MRLSMFRESIEGPVSMRRVLAAFFALASIPLGVLPICNKSESWQAFIPFGISVVASILFMFFTTWADIKETISAARAK